MAANFYPAQTNYMRAKAHLEKLQSWDKEYYPARDALREAEEKLLRWAWMEALGFARTTEQIESVSIAYRNRWQVVIRHKLIDAAMRLQLSR